MGWSPSMSTPCPGKYDLLLRSIQNRYWYEFRNRLTGSSQYFWFRILGNDTVCQNNFEYKNTSLGFVEASPILACWAVHWNFNVDRFGETKFWNGCTHSVSKSYDVPTWRNYVQSCSVCKHWRKVSQAMDVNEVFIQIEITDPKQWLSKWNINRTGTKLSRLNIAWH